MLPPVAIAVAHLGLIRCIYNRLIVKNDALPETSSWIA